MRKLEEKGMASTEGLVDRQIAVLIDLENMSLGSIQWLFDQVSDVGRIILKRAYADWTLESSKRVQLLELGIEPVPLIRSTSGGKNASDIKLGIDAVDLLYTSPVDTFVIVSSDSDFVPLVSKLRAAGKIVFGAGEQKKTPAMLVKSCDRYFYLDQDTTAGKSLEKTLSKGKDTDNLIRRAFLASVDEHGRVRGSKLHQTMLRLDPSFDYRSHGYSNFTKFLEASPVLKINRSQGSGDTLIELVEQTGSISKPGDSEDLWKQIDSAWTRREDKYGTSIPGPVASSDAALAIGIDKLSSSKYKTLQGLLEADKYLSDRWSRNKNTIVKRNVNK
ncbi:NYN domain-containing protein [Chloroflexota bacterium]